MKNQDLMIKVDALSAAMETYNTHWFYRHCGYVISFFVVLLQIVTLFNLYQTYDHTNTLILLLVFIFAFIMTDCVNGFVHMYMDNNTNYTSFAGPFIAAFHLHHSVPKYTKRNPIKVYFYESGSKFWLMVYLFVLVWVQQKGTLNYGINFGLVWFGILSSVAELSHYWCHNATKKNTIIRCLQKYHVLLARKHHALHHTSDNVQYCFLNGMTDPLVNCIARYWYAGYKQHADQHIAIYVKRTNQATQHDAN